MQKSIAGTIGLALLLVASARPQTKPDHCADPSSNRVAIIIMSDPQPTDSEYIRRKAKIETRFANALAKHWSDSCVIHTMEPLSDPKNFPLLKGTTVFEISALPSPKHNTLAALAVNVAAVQGPYAEDSVSLGAFPVLIETDADWEYGLGADLVMKKFALIGEAFNKRNH